MNTEESNQGLTVVVAEALLFAEFESGVEDSTVAVLVSELLGGATTLTPIVTVAVAEDAIVPIMTRTVPFVPAVGPRHVPTEVTQEPNVVPLGRGSLISTFVAEFGPRLVTLIV